MTEPLDHRPAEAAPGVSSGRRALLYIIVVGLAAAALVSAGFVVFGDQSAIVARALWTVLILMAFALIVLAETRSRPAESWIVPLRVGGWVLSAFVAMFNTWDYRTELSDTVFLLPVTIVSIIVIQLAVLFIQLHGRAFWKDPSPIVRISSLVATGGAAVLAIMIVLPLTLRPDDLFGETYWRIVAALAIIGAVAGIISPLVRAITRPREARPASVPQQGYDVPAVPVAPAYPGSAAPAAQPYGGPATPPATPGYPQSTAPEFTAPGAPVAPSAPAAPHAPAYPQASAPLPPWPTYYGTNVPLPVMPDGQPDFEAYRTGRPSPGSRSY